MLKGLKVIFWGFEEPVFLRYFIRCFFFLMFVITIVM